MPRDALRYFGCQHFWKVANINLRDVKQIEWLWKYVEGIEGLPINIGDENDFYIWNVSIYMYAMVGNVGTAWCSIDHIPIKPLLTSHLNSTSKLHLMHSQNNNLLQSKFA